MAFLLGLKLEEVAEVGETVSRYSSLGHLGLIVAGVIIWLPGLPLEIV